MNSAEQLSTRGHEQAVGTEAITTLIKTEVVNRRHLRISVVVHLYTACFNIWSSIYMQNAIYLGQFHLPLVDQKL